MRRAALSRIPLLVEGLRGDATGACSAARAACSSQSAIDSWAKFSQKQAARPWHPAASANASMTSPAARLYGTEPGPLSEEFMKTNLQVDTLDLALKFEEVGLTRDQARTMTKHIAEVVVRNNLRVIKESTSPMELDNAMLELKAQITGFKTEVLKTQELHLASLTRDTERLQNDSEKIRAELKYEINKLTASQRLDLNLEKGRIRDELAALREKSNDIEVRIDKEINGLKTSLEASKNDIIKYCVATILSVGIMGLGVVRLLI